MGTLLRVKRDTVNNYTETVGINWMYSHPNYKELWRTVLEM